MFGASATATMQTQLLTLAWELVDGACIDEPGFAAEGLPQLRLHYDWLARERDVDGDGLLTIIYPDESGLDDSPKYDRVFGWMRHDSPGYWWLVERYRRLGYDAHAIAQRYEEHTEDVLVNVCYALGLRALARLDAEHGDIYARRAEQTERALMERCYDESTGLFFDLAGRGERPVRVSTWSSLAPLALRALPEPVRRRLVEEHLLDERRYRAAYGIPSVALEEPSLSIRVCALALLARAGVDEHRLAARARSARIGLRRGGAADRRVAGAGGAAPRLPRVLQPSHRRRHRGPQLRLCDPPDRSSPRTRCGRRRAVRRTSHDAAVSWRSTRAAGQSGQTHRQVAVVDLGSNSWRLVVFAYGAAGSVSWWKLTDELYETVRIGAGLGASGRLGEAAMKRGMETLGVFARFCRANRIAPDDVHVVATSAIRDAANGAHFLADAQQATGLAIETLSAHDEARFGYVAAVNTTTLTDGVVLDLGGGSLQLIHVAGRRAREMVSFGLGAVRVTEQWLTGGGPAKKKELARVREYATQTLSEVDWLGSSGRRLVGLGGAVRNLAAAAESSGSGLDLGVQGFVIEPAALHELVGVLAALPSSERGTVPGIKPGRGDIILAAALVLETVLELGGFAGIEATEAGLREGVFLARTLLAGAEPLVPDVRAAGVRNLAIQYESDMTHVEHVARLALGMFDSLVDGGLFTPEEGERELLWAASMLHDVGMTISYDDHHKHSRYLIESAELPGFDPRERALVAQISRYHRKGIPKLGDIEPLAHDGDEALLDRCAVILRLAEHLERGRDQSVSEARLRANGHGVDLHLEAGGDLTLPRWSVERYGDGEAFERVFGRHLLIG